jgi:hypothetical protein
MRVSSSKTQTVRRLQGLEDLRSGVVNAVTQMVATIETGVARATVAACLARVESAHSLAQAGRARTVRSAWST